jgi:alkaline phosphatase D
VIPTKLFFNLICLSFFTLSCKKEIPTTKIGFGSCGNQDIQQPVLSLASKQNLDAFIFVGDNIYGDTDDMDTLRNKYKRWASQSHYQNLIKSTKIFATWDDHDYGQNDTGKHYPHKKESKKIFMDHFNIKEDNEMSQHEGIYHTNYIKVGDKTIQFLMLDLRTFRNDLLKYDPKVELPRKKYFYDLDYVPHTSKDSLMVGETQWQWIERELKKPADIRFICSGSQFGIEYNGYEAWANFPHEQKRMLDLINKTKANGVLFLTGDVHYAEISRLNNTEAYPIYDITSSGITSKWDFPTLNTNRIEGPVMDNHFGMITIKWEIDPIIKMEIIDEYNNQRIDYEVKLSEISFNKK